VVGGGKLCPRARSQGATVAKYLAVRSRFAAIILCTSDPGKVDKRTRSKWSRVLRYAAEYKPSSEPLAAFIQRKGGINKCAVRFTRYLGRGGFEAERRAVVLHATR
jgi:hypothetical protein